MLIASSKRQGSQSHNFIMAQSFLQIASFAGEYRLISTLQKHYITRTTLVTINQDPMQFSLMSCTEIHSHLCQRN